MNFFKRKYKVRVIFRNGKEITFRCEKFRAVYSDREDNKLISLSATNSDTYIGFINHNDVSAVISNV
jgi:hypothetical protein